MKKLFTLIGLFAVSFGAFAQSYAVAEGESITAGSQITSVAGVTMTYSEGCTWKTAASTLNVSGVAFSAYATTGTNGSYKDGQEPTGEFVKFETTKAGSITAILQNTTGNKSIILVDGSFQPVAGTPIPNDDKEEAYNTSWTSGTQLPEGTDSGDKFNGGLKFSVAQGGTYYLLVAGSKMRIMGFIFQEGGATGINTITAATDQKSETYNLLGQRVDKNAKGLVISNGKKFINK